MNSPQQGIDQLIEDAIENLKAKGATQQEIDQTMEDVRQGAARRRKASDDGTKPDDRPEKRVVESLEATFRDDLQEIVKDLPRVQDALDREERVTLDLTPSEAQALGTKTLWLLSSWVRSLAGEIDRLHDELDALAGVDDDSQGHG